MKRLILIVMAVLFVGSVTVFVNASTNGNVYSNKFVGVSFAVPAGWYIVTDNEMKELVPDAARIMGLDDPAAKEVVAQMPGKVLLFVSERPFNNNVQSENRNISLTAINARNIKNEVGSGADYLGHVARGIRENQPSARVSDIITQSLGGEKFHRLNVSIPMQGITIRMSQLARVHNDFIVILNMSADSETSLATLVQHADNNIRLSSVPLGVDSSPEGQSFRKQSSLKLSGSSGSSSSGGSLLKNLGLILMILGGFWFILNLFRSRGKKIPVAQTPKDTDEALQNKLRRDVTYANDQPLQDVAAPVQPSARSKKCPKCAEEIKFEAVICRFCQHEFDETEVLKTIKELEDCKEEERKNLEVEIKRKEESLQSQKTLKKKKAGRTRMNIYNELRRFVGISLFTIGMVFTLIFVISLFDINDNMSWGGAVFLAFISLFLNSAGFLTLKKTKKIKKDLVKIDEEIEKITVRK